MLHCVLLLFSYYVHVMCIAHGCCLFSMYSCDDITTYISLSHYIQWATGSYVTIYSYFFLWPLLCSIYSAIHMYAYACNQCKRSVCVSCLLYTAMYSTSGRHVVECVCWVDCQSCRTSWYVVLACATVCMCVQTYMTTRRNSTYCQLLEHGHKQSITVDMQLFGSTVEHQWATLRCGCILCTVDS